MPGVSGNHVGRPKGLSRRVRELVGDDGHAIAEGMFAVLSDETQRTADFDVSPLTGVCRPRTGVLAHSGQNGGNSPVP